MVEIHPQTSGNIVGIRISGKLHHDDYQKFVPLMESLIKQHGKVRLLVEMLDFHGWDLHAAWDDMKFDAKHMKDAERVAIIGESKWEQWCAKLCGMFMPSQVKYFDRKDIDSAWTWIKA